MALIFMAVALGRPYWSEATFTSDTTTGGAYVGVFKFCYYTNSPDREVCIDRSRVLTVCEDAGAAEVRPCKNRNNTHTHTQRERERERERGGGGGGGKEGKKKKEKERERRERKKNKKKQESKGGRKREKEREGGQTDRERPPARGCERKGARAREKKQESEQQMRK